jgi:arsenate reductase-like glutaredoxin family protein
MPYKDREKQLQYWRDYSKKKDKHIVREKAKEYRKAHPERCAETHKRYYLKNKEEISERNRDWWAKNKEKMDGWRSEYNKKNKEKMRKWYSEYNKKNREAINEYQRKWRAANKDKQYAYYLRSKDKILESQRKCYNKVGKAICRQIYEALKEKKAGRHWEYLVGYTIKDLIMHLESQFTMEMNWNNYGSHWCIDHRIPQSWFHFESTDDENFKRCFSLDNLQPMSNKNNYFKNSRFAGTVDKPIIIGGKHAKDNS